MSSSVATESGTWHHVCNSLKIPWKYPCTFMKNYETLVRALGKYTT